MRSLPIVILLALLATVAAVTACTGSTRADSRLAAADSLMEQHPDSAYALLSAIVPESLGSDADHAYYALLMTQAMYRNYITIENDSLINVATAYYADNRNRERYTRSLLYKGTVMEDMGNPVEAMKYYKRAEANADPHDYNNIGCINLRMAVLYQNSYTNSDEDVTKYKIALANFKKSNNKKLQLVSLNSLGSAYRKSNTDSAYRYIGLAIKLATQIRDSSTIFLSYSILSRAYWTDSLYQESKDCAIYVITNGLKFVTTQNVFYDAARSYANMGNPDSALYYLKQTRAIANSDDQLSRLITLKEIEKSRKNFKQSLYYADKAEFLADSMEKVSKRGSIHNTEKISDIKQMASISATNIRNRKIIVFGAFLFLIGICFFVFLAFKYKSRKQLTENLIRMSQKEKLDVDTKLMMRETILNDALEEQISTFQKLVEYSSLYETDTKRFLKHFKESINMSQAKGIAISWSKLRIYVNSNNHNIINYLSENHPILNQDDLKIIELVCCRFPYKIIAICMGYKNFRYAYNKSDYICKKLQFEGSLENYIEQFNSNAEQLKK